MNDAAGQRVGEAAVPSPCVEARRREILREIKLRPAAG
jgi:hypothetical protein